MARMFYQHWVCFAKYDGFAVTTLRERKKTAVPSVTRRIRRTGSGSLNPIFAA